MARVPAGGGQLSGAAVVAVRFIVVVAAIVVGLWLIGQLRLVVFPIVLGMFVAALLSPSAQWLRRHRVSRGLSTVIVCFGALAVAGALITVLIPPTLGRLDELADNVGKAIEDVREFLERMGLTNERLSELFEQAREEASSSGDLTERALAGVQTLGEILIGFVLTIVLGIYFVYDGDRLFHSLVTLLPQRRQAEVISASQQAWQVLGRYVRGVAIVGVVDAVLIATALLVLGVPLVLPLALITFVGAFLPFVGAFLSGLLAALVAFVSKGFVVALLVVTAAVVVQQLEGHVVAPQIFGRALELPPVLVILAITTGGLVGGVMGAFIAAPVTAVVMTLLRGRATGQRTPSREG